MKYLKQLTLFDADTGEHVLTKTLDEGSQNEGEWIIMYRNAISQLLDEAPNFTTLKVFLKLMQMQEYDKPIKTTKQAVADMLNTAYNHTHAAFKWLEQNNYIVETKLYGQSQFDLNPNVTTCGKNRKKKLQRWNEITAIKKTTNNSNLPPAHAINIIDLSDVK